MGILGFLLGDLNLIAHQLAPRLGMCGDIPLLPRTHSRLYTYFSAGTLEMNTFFFNLPNLSRRTMALGFTQHLRETNTRRYFWGKARPVRKDDNLTAICEPIV
jgi:hypothetical protein